MKAEDIRAMSPDERSDQLLALKREQITMRFQNAEGLLEDKSRMRTVRRDIARILTVSAERGES